MNYELKNKGLTIVDIISWVAGLLVGGWLLFALFFNIYNVPSSSMEPLLEVGDKVLVRKVRFGELVLQRNDIIVFQEANQNLIKKIVGLPGDEVKYNLTHVFVNGVLVVQGAKKVQAIAHQELKAENDINSELNTAEYEVILKAKRFLLEGDRDTFQTVTLQSNEYFVLGENFSDSTDSRFFGAIQDSDIIGKALLVHKQGANWKLLTP
ncbi:MAG: signal peptidase I [Deltaproteobacteria bacterium]|nr:signal peptidase I [Deltaproteobacteria bacterium]